MLAPDMPMSVYQALEDADELVELLKKQGLEGMELCKTYVPQVFKMLIPFIQQLTNLDTENAPSTASNWGPFRRL
jgi:hypothetical protein